MTTPNLENINVSAFDNMPTPAEIHAKLPISDKAGKTVNTGATCCARFSTARITACSSSSAPAPSTTRSPASITPIA